MSSLLPYPYLPLPLFLSFFHYLSPSQPLFVWQWFDQTKPTQGDCQRWFFNLTARTQWVLDRQAKFPPSNWQCWMKIELASALRFVTHVIICSIIPAPLSILPWKWGYNGPNFDVYVAGPHVPPFICFIKKLYKEHVNMSGSQWQPEVNCNLYELFGLKYPENM